jgi:hypothetical protein
MSMTVTYQSKRYAPELVVERYVRRSSVDSSYTFCEVGEDRRWDLRQGKVDGEDIPEDIRSKADGLRDQAFGYVPWPIV